METRRRTQDGNGDGNRDGNENSGGDGNEDRIGEGGREAKKRKQPHKNLKKNLNASRPSEHPPVRGKYVKALRWDHRLQRQNLFMAFKRAPLWY